MYRRTVDEAAAGGAPSQMASASSAAVTTWFARVTSAASSTRVRPATTGIPVPAPSTTSNGPSTPNRTRIPLPLA